MGCVKGHASPDPAASSPPTPSPPSAPTSVPPPKGEDGRGSTPSLATSISPSTSTPVEPPKTKPRAELPLGGRDIFPAHRLVGFCGTPGAPALGKLAGDL